MIPTKSLIFVDTTTAISLVVAVEAEILENPLTAEGGAATLAAPTVVVTAVSEATVVDMSSHSSSSTVPDLVDDGMNGSQKSHVDEGGGGGGGSGVEAVLVVDVVHVSEVGLMGGGGGGGGCGVGVCGGGGEGRVGGKWWS